jgi:hypothetical protein
MRTTTSAVKTQPTVTDVEEARKIMKVRVPSKAAIYKKLVSLYGSREGDKDKKRQRADQRLKAYESDEIRKAKQDCCRDNQTPEAILEEAGAIRMALDKYAELDAVYVGRPYHQGYRVPSLKIGSVLANPFSVKENGGGSMDTILKKYRLYIQSRLVSKSKEELVNTLLTLHGITLSDRPHLQLNVVGKEFQTILDQHSDKNLACVCKLSEPCHVDILLELK